MEKHRGRSSEDVDKGLCIPPRRPSEIDGDVVTDVNAYELVDLRRRCITVHNHPLRNDVLFNLNVGLFDRKLFLKNYFSNFQYLNNKKLIDLQKTFSMDRKQQI